MPLNTSRGNMYPWVSHTHSHLRGVCPHGCLYCYVQAHERRWGTGAFAGPLRLEEKELAVNYGRGKICFIEHQNDLFAEGVPPGFVTAILSHCCLYPNNVYVFQSKNPRRMLAERRSLPPAYFLGTTIESDIHHRQMNCAPRPSERFVGGLDFVTVEPIMAFSDDFAHAIAEMHPRWVNIGADSKGHRLPEPSGADVAKFIDRLTALGVPIREKHNLGRLLDSARG